MEVYESMGTVRVTEEVMAGGGKVQSLLELAGLKNNLTDANTFPTDNPRKYCGTEYNAAPTANSACNQHFPGPYSNRQQTPSTVHSSPFISCVDYARLPPCPPPNLHWQQTFNYSGISGSSC